MLLDPRTGAVVTGDDLAAAYEQMLAQRPDVALPAPPAAVARPGWVRPATVIGLVVVALLPFLWLSVLHYSLGRMLGDLRAQATKAEKPRGEDDPVVVELKRMGQQLAELEREVDEAGRARPPRASRPRGNDDEDDDDDAPREQAPAGAEGKRDGSAPGRDAGATDAKQP